MSKPLALLHYSNLLPGGQLANRLQDLGYRVQTLADLARLTETCQNERPLLVVVEILPGGPALACISRMKKEPSTQHIPVLGYSSAQDPAQQAQATEAGVSLLAGNAAISEHLPRLLDQVLQVDETTANPFAAKPAAINLPLVLEPATNPPPVKPAAIIPPPIKPAATVPPAPKQTVTNPPVAKQEATNPSGIKLDRGIHALHLFYRVDRERWAQSAQCLSRLEALCAANAQPSHPRLTTYATIGGKADLAFFLLAAELGQLGQMHRDLEACFSPGALVRVFSYVSVTELSEYMPTEEEHRQKLIDEEKLAPGSEAFDRRMSELRERMKQYEHYRLYPEMPDWEVMGFYPMSKRRAATDNWYTLDFAARRKLMAGHAKVGRKYAGRVSQLITGSTGLDDWEWGVTLMAHQLDALKEIVYEMRFDEVSARYADFGPFFVNMRLRPAELWAHLHL